MQDQATINLLNQISSVLNEILQMETSEKNEGQEVMDAQDNLAQLGTEVNEKEVTKEAPTQEEITKMVKKAMDDLKANEGAKTEVKKTIVDTSPEGQATARSDAEDRYNLNTEASDEALEEVKKALGLLLNKSKVNKTANETSKIMKSLNAIEKRQRDHETVINEVLKGLGVANEIEKISKSQNQEEPVRKGLANTDSEKMLQEQIGKMLLENLQKQPVAKSYKNPTDQARKESLPALMNLYKQTIK